MMIEVEKPWKVSEIVEQKIYKLALAHIKKVEANPDVKTEGDNFDYWNSFKLEDGTHIDYNIYCGDEWCVPKQDGSGEYEYTHYKTWSWDVSIYAVDLPTQKGGYGQINTDKEQCLFTYNKSYGNFEVDFDV